MTSATIINQTTFVKGLIGDDSILHTEKPYIVFMGRSNVGKSSLINSLTGNKGLAKSSSTPGKTLQINVFQNEDCYILDFPGYGYARVDHAKREKIRKMIIWYMTECTDPKSLFVLVTDAKAGITDYEKEVLQVLNELNLPYVVIANKIDKLNQSETASLRKDLDLIIPRKEYILYSSTKHKGKDELMEQLTQFV